MPQSAVRPFNRLRISASAILFSLLISSSYAGSFDDYMNSLRNDQISPILGLQLRNFDLNTRDAKGNPALLVAISNDSFKVAEYLVQQPGLDLDATNPNGENALMLAALKGHLGIARALIARGAQVNKPGWAPLHYAATSAAAESVQMVKLLLEHYAYIDAASPNQSTPLMMAARYGNEQVVQLLLAEGADPALKNDKGMTAVDFAKSVSRAQVAQLIAARVQVPSTAAKPALEPVAAESTQVVPVAEPIDASPSTHTDEPQGLPVPTPRLLERPLSEETLLPPEVEPTPATEALKSPVSEPVQPAEVSAAQPQPEHVHATDVPADASKPLLPESVLDLKPFAIPPAVSVPSGW